ncbi:MAG: Crp/Fnr family transcriptional regulator [Ignavibacteriales bacterium]|nr:Crp/Fnr family transcriptional regulator [Ignavibacteriales bacterium]
MNINRIIIKDKLRELHLFSELDTEQLMQIASISSIDCHKKNDVIFREGSIYKGFYILLKGTIKVYRKTSRGKELTLHIIKPFNAFADVPLFEGKIYPVNAQAVDDCTLLFIPGDGFKKLLLENPTICFKMLSGFAKRMRALTRKVEDLTLKDVSIRLAEYLINEVIRSGTEKLTEPIIKLVISKKTLASYLGTITEILSRTFHKLENEGLIRVADKKIFIKDFNRLREMAR